jgi:hypothetical protein
MKELMCVSYVIITKTGLSSIIDLDVTLAGVELLHRGNI